jgi:hypothetical protein
MAQRSTLEDILAMARPIPKGYQSGETIGPVRPGNTMVDPTPAQPDRLWESFLSAYEGGNPLGSEGGWPGGIQTAEEAGFSPPPYRPGQDAVMRDPNWDFGQEQFVPRSDREQRAQTFGQDLGVMAPIAAGATAGGGPLAGLVTLLGGMSGGQASQRVRESGAGEAGAFAADALTDTAVSTIVGGPGAGVVAGGKSVIKALARKGAKGAYTKVVPDLRAMTSVGDITDAVSRQLHLIKPGPGKAYTGAPPSIKGPKSLQKMRDGYDRHVRQGAAIGGPWYDNVGEDMTRMAPGREASLSHDTSLWSANRTPSVGMGLAVKGNNAAVAGNIPNKINTKAQAAQFQRYRETGVSELGLKQGNFQIAQDPNQGSSIGGVHDLWDGRIFGYPARMNKKGEMVPATLGANQHRFMDYELEGVARRMNEERLLGRTDWTADRVQAAAWTSVGGEDRLVKDAAGKYGGSLDAAMRSMGDTDFAPQYAVNLTSESIPSGSGDHLAGLADQPFDVKDAYTRDPRSQWDPEGRDILGDAAGLYSTESRRSVGMFYNPETGVTEFNPNYVAKVLSSFDYTDAGYAALSDTDRAIIDGIETYRAYADNQFAGAWNKGIPVGKQGVQVQDANGINIPTGQLNEQQMRGLAKAANDAGFNTDSTFPIGNDDGMILIDFAVDRSDPKDLARYQKLMNERMAKLEPELKKLGINSPLERQFVDTNLLDFDKFPEFTHKYYGYRGYAGERTDILLERLKDPRIPALFDRLDKDPALRKMMLGLIERDEQWAKMGGNGPLSESLQRARQIIADGGLKALEAARKAGVVLPAVALPVLGDALDTEQRQVAE